MELKDALVKNKPRETSGSTSSSRFDFQKDFSICKLLETHLIEGDYVFLFDFQEDLVIIDSEVAPSKISFYQIKGKKSGNWTLNDLLKRKKSKNDIELLSILGKLYDCKLKYKDATESLNFVSNQRFSIKLQHGDDGITKNNVCFIELSKEDIEKIKNQLKKEHTVENVDGFEDITFYKVTELSLDDSEIHTIGKLTDFLDNLFPETSFKAKAIYRNLFNEVKRRSDNNTDFSSLEELIDKKGISKKKLIKWIENLKLDKDFKELWQTINGDLRNEGISAIKRNKLKKTWVDLELKFKNPNDDSFYNALNKVSESVEKLKGTNFNELKNVFEIVELVAENIKSGLSNSDLIDEDLLSTIILFKLYE